MRNPAAEGSPATPVAGAGGSAPLPRAGWTEASLAVMVLIWGVNFAVAKRAIAAIDPLAFNALRYLLASGFVLAVLGRQGRLSAPSRGDLPRVFLLGLVGNTLYQMAFILGLDRTQAGNASLMLALMPVFVLLLGLRGGVRHGARAWVGAVMSVVGVALVSGSSLRVEGSTALVGELILISASAFWALYTQGAEPLIARYGAVQTTAWTLWAGAVGIFLLGVPALLRQPWSAVDPVAWGGLLFSAFFSIGLAYLLWYRGVERLGGARTAVYSNLTPVVALVAGAVGLGERLTLASLAGAALVIFGVMLVRR